MVDVGPTVLPARVTRASLDQGTEIFLERRILDVQTKVAAAALFLGGSGSVFKLDVVVVVILDLVGEGEGQSLLRAVMGVAGIEHVDAELDQIQDAEGIAAAWVEPGLLLGQDLEHLLHDVRHLRDWSRVLGVRTVGVESLEKEAVDGTEGGLFGRVAAGIESVSEEKEKRQL